ncbi:uncharacterized protein LACBIDRAFT_334093 [Laccaria bicolor S238N-H82]|uniref:Predicted protein n=1 Tax=Laccaria bicolor (strain S238N-H82 / ATCC MYA-4686) TaxID=486041 RepID=B0DY26_LACBS|nr:uncharacterized protein LACBIDRAFT_334093 [Laccaria bicolor S238N-H82]EDR00489.1 predicted protein [Laccaria bicolor S238N-H82]|eukprot:XP_001888881.1 predicted protein [Laccaria bicolor S238N-H82]
MCASLAHLNFLTLTLPAFAYGAKLQADCRAQTSKTGIVSPFPDSVFRHSPRSGFMPFLQTSLHQEIDGAQKFRGLYRYIAGNVHRKQENYSFAPFVTGFKGADVLSAKVGYDHLIPHKYRRKSDLHAPDTPTYAILNLGGASKQIVFEPVFTSSDTMQIEGEHNYDLQFGGRSYVLY